MSKLNRVFITLLILAVPVIVALKSGKIFKKKLSPDSGITLKVAFPNLKFESPVEFVSPSDGTKRNFVIEQEGVIRVFKNSPEVKSAPIFLNIKKKVRYGGEMGLLGLAFHPDYKRNGYFYVNYTAGENLHTVISRFKVSKTNPNIADAASEQILMTFDQPFQNHNGGKVAFGKDGFLYIATSDDKKPENGLRSCSQIGQVGQSLLLR